MMVCEHFSQRSTCPPSAAVRERSIADITLRWPRLIRPALAERPAAPWSRKISATSSFGRHTAAGYAGGWSVLGVSLRWWAAHLAEGGRHRAARQVAPRRGAWRCVAIAGLQHRAQHPD